MGGGGVGGGVSFYKTDKTEHLEKLLVFKEIKFLNLKRLYLKPNPS